MPLFLLFRLRLSGANNWIYHLTELKFIMAMKQTWILMRPLDAARMSESGPVYYCHYIGLVFTWKGGVGGGELK